MTMSKQGFPYPVLLLFLYGAKMVDFFFFLSLSGLERTTTSQKEGRM
jgi:hypothetical protein